MNEGGKDRRYLDRSRVVLRSPDDVRQFLLETTVDKPILYDDVIQGTVDSQRIKQIFDMTTCNPNTPEQNRADADLLRRSARKLAETHSKKFDLSDEDSIALEQLYEGLTQANLIEYDEAYSADLMESERTSYSSDITSGFPEPASDEDFAENENLDLTRDMKPIDIKLSPKLWKVLMTEFNYIGLVEKGIQVRRSVNPIFARSAMLAMSLIQLIENDPYKYPVINIQIRTIDKILDEANKFSNFRDNLTP